MGFRFRKTIKLFPGVRLNVSKSGVSSSIGGRGATVNLSKRGTRTTVGIPGTGISYVDTKPPSRHQEQFGQTPPSNSANWVLRIIVAVVVFAIAFQLSR